MPAARAMPFGFAFVRLVDGVDLNDPAAAAEGRRVFELANGLERRPYRSGLSA